MVITTFFTENGAPKTGLGVSITIYDISDGSAVTTSAAMTEVAGGFYKYTLTAFDVDTNYAFVSDSGAGQAAGERYAFGTSGINGDMKFVRDIEGGRWKIDTGTNQMTFYEADNSTTVATFDLKGESGTATSEDVYERSRV